MNCQLALKALVDKCLNNNQACSLCDQRALQPYPLCDACETALPWLIEQCTRCALPLPDADQVCARCSLISPAFASVVALWQYGFPVDALISRYKHNQRWPLGRLMARLLGHALHHRFGEGLPRPDLLLPVPLARSRLRQRGFNQAALLARWLSAQVHIPHNERWVLRNRDTAAQQTLSAKARRRNLHGAFCLARCAEVTGLHLAIIDDVLTTGATAQAMARVLRKAGAARVDVYCLARTPSPEQT